jgi:hypothetical protein
VYSKSKPTREALKIDLNQACWVGSSTGLRRLLNIKKAYPAPALHKEIIVLILHHGHAVEQTREL